MELVRALDTVTAWGEWEDRDIISLGGGSRHDHDLASATKILQKSKTTFEQFLLLVGDILSDRIAEIKYSPNVSLYQSVTNSLSRVGGDFFHKNWMTAVTPVMRDCYILDRISFFQQCVLVQALGRLRFSDQATFAALGKMLMRNLDLFKEVAHVAPILLVGGRGGGGPFLGRVRNGSGLGEVG